MKCSALAAGLDPPLPAVRVSRFTSQIRVTVVTEIRDYSSCMTLWNTRLPLFFGFILGKLMTRKN
jgi:hypothetical protein